MKKVTKIFSLLITFLLSGYVFSYTETDSIAEFFNKENPDSLKIKNFTTFSFKKISQNEIYVDSAIHWSKQFESDKKQAEALQVLAGKLYDSSMYNETLPLIRKANTIFFQLNDTVNLSYTYNLLGITLTALSDYEEAIIAHRRAIVFDSMRNDTTGLAVDYLNLGIAYEYYAKYKAAITYYMKALDIAESKKDTLDIANLYNNLANVYHVWGNYNKALDYYLKAIEMFEEKQDKAGLAVVYNNIGIIYHDWKNYDKALDYYIKGYKIEKKLNRKEGLASSLNNIAIIYDEKKQYDTALALYKASLRIEEELGEKRGIAIELGNIGEFLYNLERYDEAMEYYQRALKLYRQIGADDGLARIYNQIGMLQQKTGNEQMAIYNFKKSLAISLNKNISEIAKENYKYLAEIYARKNNYSKAYEYLLLFNQIKDSIFSKDIHDQLTAMQHNYEMDQKEKEIKLLNAQKEKNQLILEQQKKQLKYNRIITLVISSLLLVIIIITILLRKQYLQKTKANKLLKDQKSELEKNRLELIKAKDKAEESDRLKSSFIANMSHEIRTPMNGIIGFSELIKTEGIQDEQTKSYLDIVIDNGKKLIGILDNLLDISLIETNQLQLKYADFNLTNLLDELQQTYKAKADIANKPVNIQLLSDPDYEDIFLHADEFRVKQIIDNILANAYEYTEKGEIKFGYKVNTTNKYIDFFITDTGIGIPKKIRSVIFDRFRQADESFTRKHGGTGLGLTISKRLVEMMGGKIWLKSQEGKGSTFRFTLPLKPNSV